MSVLMFLNLNAMRQVAVKLMYREDGTEFSSTLVLLAKGNVLAQIRDKLEALYK